MKKTAQKEQGFIFIGIIIIIVVITAVLFVLVNLILLSLSNSNRSVRKLSALEVAEAGINYYLWHLSHAPADYKDGGTTPAVAPYGPYTHDYFDNSGDKIGTYTLYITPPSLGSSLVTVKATGTVVGGKEVRTIQSHLGIPSFAQYIFLSNTEAWFGPSETTNGKVHSNLGVHYDGTASDLVSAANSTYTPQASFGGDGNSHPGVWGTGTPTSLWVYPVPSIDFSKVTTDLTQIRANASSFGILLPQAGGIGYYLKLNANSTIDVYRVNSESSSGINTTFINTQAAPSNGLIFSDMDVWVDGTWDGRMTIAAANFPDIASTNRSITIKGNLLYAQKDGSDVLGLIAQKDIKVPQYSPNNLEIDAAMLAQKGHVYRPFFSGNTKNTITVYGSIETFDWWTWNYVNGSGTNISGYQTTINTYDSNLTLSAPPSFPLTGSFAVLDWRELQ